MKSVMTAEEGIELAKFNLVGYKVVVGPTQARLKKIKAGVGPMDHLFFIRRDLEEKFGVKLTNLDVMRIIYAAKRHEASA